MDTDPIQVLPEDFSNGFKGMMVGSLKGKVLSYKSRQQPCDPLCHKLIRSKRDGSSLEGRVRWRVLSCTPVPGSLVSVGLYPCSSYSLLVGIKTFPFLGEEEGDNHFNLGFCPNHNKPNL